VRLAFDLPGKLPGDQDARFTLVPVSGPARSAGGRPNRLRDQDRPVHDWYRFILSYPPHFVREWLDEFGIVHGSRQAVLDPFCGTGTTLVECKKRGVRAYGLDAHPISILASDVKTDWSVDPSALLRHSLRIAQRLGASGSTGNQLSALSPEAARLLPSRVITSEALSDSLRLVDAIRSARTEAYKPWQELALAKALVTEIGNLRFGPEVGVRSVPRLTGRTPVEAWLDWIEHTSRDLRSIRRDVNSPGRVTVLKADARDSVPREIEDESISAVVTSPPYPNEKDYTRATRLESVVLGLITSHDDLRRIKQPLIRSNSRNVFIDDLYEPAILQFKEIVELATRVEVKRLKLGKTAGFERLYYKIVLLYFGGMYGHLAHLRRVLAPNARCAYVLGDQASFLQVKIETARLVGCIAEELGYTVERVHRFRTRRATGTGDYLNENVLELRWPGRRLAKITLPQVGDRRP